MSNSRRLIEGNATVPASHSAAVTLGETVRVAQLVAQLAEVCASLSARVDGLEAALAPERVGVPAHPTTAHRMRPRTVVDE